MSKLASSENDDNELLQQVQDVFNSTNAVKTAAPNPEPVDTPQSTQHIFTSL